MIAILWCYDRLLSESLDIIHFKQILASRSFVIFLKSSYFFIVRLNFSRLGLKHSYLWCIKSHKSFLLDIKHEICRLRVIIRVSSENFSWTINEELFMERFWYYGTLRFKIFLLICLDVNRRKTAITQNRCKIRSVLVIKIKHRKYQIMHLSRDNNLQRWFGFNRLKLFPFYLFYHFLLGLSLEGENSI